MSMTNRKLSQRGFSLIELMVAVAILSMVIFGIFLAFSTGFRGMADARDRTEAVNYIQKTLEEYKNTSFNEIQDKPMSLIEGTKFSNGSIVIDKETRLKKVITQVRWTARNGDIKLEEASTLIYATEKTGELLEASEIVLYASPYFRILPFESTDLFAEIHDANGNIVTNKDYTVNFTILNDPDLGYLSPDLDVTNNGIASVEFVSDTDVADGSVTIQASADLNDDSIDDVFDTIVITISTGAEGITLVPSFYSSLAGTPVNVDLYVVDASFDYELGDGSHIIPYDGEITLSISSVPEGIATLSTTTINPTEGTASFTLNSNGTPGTVEIIASAPDLDLGYTEVTFTGGAESIRLTPNYGSIYEGESIKITITILDENNNPTPFTGSITMESGSIGNFDSVDPTPFVEESSGTVNFSHDTATDDSIAITATGDGGLTSNTIYIDVLDSLTPSYIELTAAPSSVEADDSDFSIVKATIYDDSVPSKIVTNYNGTIYFYTSLDGSYFDFDSVELLSDDGGKCHVNLYSTFSGDTIITAQAIKLFTTIYSQAPNPVVEFYSSEDGLRISSSKSSVIANGEDYTVISVEIIDVSENIVSNYSGNISLITDKGYFEGGSQSTTLNFDEEGSKSINLYSSSGVSEDANITAEASDFIGSGFTATASISISFTQPDTKNIILTSDPIERYGAGHGNDEYVKFYIEVTGSTIILNSMIISWDDSSSRNLIEIAIKSPDSLINYTPIISMDASSPYTANISTTLYEGKSEIRLEFSKSIAGKTIEVIFYDNEVPSNSYPLTPPMQIAVP